MGLTDPTIYHSQFANQPPAVIVTTSIIYSRRLSNLAKIYTNDIKYSGYNHSFTFKLAILNNICLRAYILLKIKMKVFSTMLKGLVLDHYYLNISINAVAMNFDQVCNSIMNYFEETKYKQSVFLK